MNNSNLPRPRGAPRPVFLILLIFERGPGKPGWSRSITGQKKEGNIRTPNYEIVRESDDVVLIRDLGPWDKYPTITNGAEEVVAELAPILRGRRLEYYDSEGHRDEIVVAEGRFVGFRCL